MNANRQQLKMSMIVMHKTKCVVGQLCLCFMWMLCSFLALGKDGAHVGCLNRTEFGTQNFSFDKQDTKMENRTSNTQIPSEGLSAQDDALFLSLREQGLYYDLQTIMHDINANKLKTGIVDLMSVHNRSAWISKMRKSYQARDQIKKKKRMIFINVETVYSSKREMITKAVARILRGKHMTSPPKFMGDIRIILGPGVARKLFYSLTKYSTAYHIQQALATQAVVLERYWLHHAAFIISKAMNSSDLPPEGHPIYKWPQDLIVPDIIFFVNATKDKTTGFHQPYTPFTDRLITVVRRVEGVRVVELNPSKNYMKIVKYIINYLKENFSNDPDIIVPNLENNRLFPSVRKTAKTEQTTRQRSETTTFIYDLTTTSNSTS